MTTVVVIGLIWLAAALLVGLLVGRAIYLGDVNQHPKRTLARPSAEDRASSPEPEPRPPVPGEHYVRATTSPIVATAENGNRSVFGT